MPKKLTVVQDAEKPVEQEVLAQAIIDISAAMRKLSAGKLNRKAIVVLLAHATKLRLFEITMVLDALEQLERDYCK